MPVYFRFPDQSESDIADQVYPGALEAAIIIPSATCPSSDAPHPAFDATEKVRISIANNVKWLMSMDRKVGPLKDLQGYMWSFAYADGKVQGL
jgi:hypothetical protein